MTLGLLAFGLIAEPEEADLPPPASFGQQFRRSLAIFKRDGNFRHFLYLRMALMIAGSATPFLAVYVQKNLGGSVGMVGVYLATYSAANLIANVLFGRYSARLGNRNTLTLATVAGLAMTTLALALILLAAPLGLSGLAASLWLLPVFILSAVRESGLGVAAQSLLLDLAPREDRTIYLGFTNSLLGVVFFATGLSGVVVNLFGYPALLIVTILAHLVGLNSALRMKR
jgi:MFS family permease